MSEGALKIWLHRYSDKPARLSLKRMIGPAGVGMSIEEMRELRVAIDLVEEQLSVAPQSEGSHSSLDLNLLVSVHREHAA
jgi:hypothetical protein